ncbi:hypothetical protein LTR64_002415 [Lithohypha guttulata]|uniref:uncharacterized protein n=1 Tax=Lithohypha guttulata TaxID=1690604 RepID=UPI002DDEE587|nr:hypothetical protein LTR51_001360 [Lithohypha guttulata]
MQSAPHQDPPNATSTNTHPSYSTNQHGLSTTDQFSDSRSQESAVREPTSIDDTPDDASVVSSATSRGRRANLHRVSTGRDSQESSPGSRIDAYEKANTIPRRPSDGMIFQLVPSSGQPGSGVSLLDVPNEVLTHILSHLPPESLSLMSLVNSRLHRLVTTPPAWRIAFARFFPGSESLETSSAAGVADETQKPHRRAFTRVSALASWRSEYILRTRLLRSLTRGRPAIQMTTDKGQKSKAPATATIMYNSGLMYPGSHIHANFGVGLNKKQPLFVHGAVEQGTVTSSDPATGKASGWGLADFEAFKHFADLYTGEAPYGLGSGDVVGMTNVMDVSQPFGKLYGEACPGGRLFYTNTAEQRGRFLMVSSPASYSDGIPEVSPVNAAITSVWLAKSEGILKVTNGLFGALAGSSTGVLSAYAIGTNPVYDRRFDRGELTARWAICPGVPIVAISVDHKVSARRIGRQRIWATVLNALGEVFYLINPPIRPDTRGKLSESELDRLAWQTGRTTEWQMLELSRRTGKNDPFQFNTIDGSYTPRSSSAAQGLNHFQLEAEAKELTQFLKYKPKHFQALCDGWDMRRSLLADYGGDDHHGGGESVFVVSHGGEDHLPAAIRRYTRHRTKLLSSCDQDAYPAIAAPQRQSIFGTPSQRSSVMSSPGYSAPRSRTSSTDDFEDTLFESSWRLSNHSFGPLKTIELSALAVDDSDFAVLSVNEDPLLGMSGGSDTSSPMTSPFGKTNLAATAAEIPGHRARLFAVGTTTGTIMLWDMRAASPPAADIVNTIAPVRVIYTRSPQISSLAMTSLYLVHGGNDGLVQAWDVLASTTEPVRTINSRFSDRARRRMAQADAAVQDVGINYYAAGAVILDPDPTMLRGMVTLGTHLRYWSFSAGAADAYKSRKRGQLRRRSNRGSTSTPEQKYHHTGRGVLKDIIADERFELEHEKTIKQKEEERLSSRFGTALLGEGISEEEMLAYAALLSEESYTSDQLKRNTNLPATYPSASTVAPAEIDDELEEAIRLSLLDTDIAAESPQTTEHNVPIRYGKKSKQRAPLRQQQSSPPMLGRSTSEQDMEFALQLSMAEQESQRLADEYEFPTLQKSHSGSSVEGKGKSRKR